ncbi:hypothetical protein BH11PSE13_BH11PSE13_21070 [soil metagenome]
MTRAAIKGLKRRVHAGLRPGATDEERRVAQQAAVLLLQRSIVMKHHRLSLCRLVDAVALGAPVDAGAWSYCSAVTSDPAQSAALAKMHSARPARFM